MALLGAGAMLVSGCGGGDPAPESAGTTEAAPVVYRVGEDVEGGGLVVNVAAPRTEQTAGDRTAPDGQKFVVLDAEVTNNTGEGLDLSCGTEIGHRLIDDQQRRFDVVPALDTVPGNRPCADLVVPGATGRISWVFAVPADSTPTAFGFYDTLTQQPTNAKVVDLTAH